MNERPSTTGFRREGFIDPAAQPPAPQAQPAPAPAPAQVQAPLQPVPASMPPPEIEPSPVEQETRIEVEQTTWPIVVKLLYKPLVIPGEKTYTEISFREPRGGDINRYGNPCRINQEGEILIEERKMHYIMAALSGILPPYLDMLDTRDWNSCAFRLRAFFAPDPRAWL